MFAAQKGSCSLSSAERDRPLSMNLALLRDLHALCQAGAPAMMPYLIGSFHPLSAVAPHPDLPENLPLAIFR